MVVWGMTLGRSPQQLDLLDPVTRFCDDTLAPNSIYGFLHRQGVVLFPDAMFADLFADVGRRSMPPGSVVGTARAGSGSPTPCWSTCASGCAARRARTVSSRWRWTPPRRPG